VTAQTCPACAAEVYGADRYCEACGHDLTQAAPTRPAQPAGRWLSSAGAPPPCPGCGGTDFGAEGYCDTCGQRRPSGRDHSELDLGGLAGVSDLGRRHHRNEDAMGLGWLPRAELAVVCDGVSSSSRPDAASHAAVEAATGALFTALRKGIGAEPAIGVAARAAQASAALVAGPEPGDNPPSCTFVCAVVTAEAVTVGWVGDSRAYWLPDGTGDAAACLTADDSLAGQLAAAGVEVPTRAQNPQVMALVRWLGADARDTVPHITTFTPAGPGRVLVCSDGLFRYRPEPADLAAATPRGPALATAGSLVRLALGEGGADNVTVVVLNYPPTAYQPQAYPASEPSGGSTR
jgi:serine/threonine protein phosphatase PrpC